MSHHLDSSLRHRGLCRIARPPESARQRRLPPAARRRKPHRTARPCRGWQWWLRRSAVSALALTVALCGVTLVAYAMVDIPEPHPEAVVQSTVFLDARGDHLGRRGPVDRQEVPLSRVPRHVQDAVIAAENRSFRTDPGIAPTAIARAVLAAITGGARQGGSTITQQYVKNALLSPDRSMSRKVREALIAVKLDRTRSKQDILQEYLNTVYFGRGAAGIQAAARNYFGVDAGELTVSQGAALAAVINLPSYYERAGSNPEVTAVLQHRWAWVLDAMASSGAITADQRAQAAFPAFRFYPPGRTEGQRQYLIDVAAAEAAEKLGMSQEELARGGYTVHTTFDLALQDTAAETVRAQAGTAAGTRRAASAARLHTAIAAVVPGDGAVRLLYGGGDYARQPFNDAVNGAVEAGTALAPFQTVRLGPPLDRLRRTATPSPLEMAAAHAALAGQGRYAAPYTVTRITRGATTVYTARRASRPVMTATEATAIAGGLRTLSPPGPQTVHTGGAADRTAWSTVSGPHLALTVALFAEHPPTAGRPARPAGLTGLTRIQPPTAAAAQTAAGLWPDTPSAGPQGAPGP